MSEQKPRAIDTKSRTTKTYTITLADCEVRPAPHTKKTYRPAHLTVIKTDGNVSRLELTGPNIKKDGSDSEVWTRETFYSHSARPDWLEPIIKGLA